MARLMWRKPRLDGGRGQTWAPWVYALKGKTGSYVIRDERTHQVLYVGESHTRRLFETLTRHLQQWNGYGSGVSYANERKRLEVAVIELPSADVEDKQYELIARLAPRDNQRDGHSLYDVDEDEAIAAAAAIDDDLSDIPF
jgi:hypothetical protein